MLWWFYDHKVTFDSSLQSDTLALILRQTQFSSQFYIILNIRFRKSLLYQFLMILHLMNIYVIMMSYCALKQNIHHHCCSLDLLVHIWEKNTFKLLLSVMMMKMEQTSTQSFQNWVQTAYINDAVKMIFNDETHTVITAFYQTNIQNFCELQYLDIFIVHLTAMLPSSMYVWFQFIYKLMKNQKMLCACSQCLNI